MSDHRDGPAVLVLLSFFAHSFFGCCIPRSFLSTLSFLVIIGISAIFKSCFVYALPIAKNGQIFTNALAIIDAPQMNRYVEICYNSDRCMFKFHHPHHSVQHAGSNLVLAIDASRLSNNIICLFLTTALAVRFRETGKYHKQPPFPTLDYPIVSNP